MSRVPKEIGNGKGAKGSGKDMTKRKGEGSDRAYGPKFGTCFECRQAITRGSVHGRKVEEEESKVKDMVKAMVKIKVVAGES